MYSHLDRLLDEIQSLWQLNERKQNGNNMTMKQNFNANKDIQLTEELKTLETATKRRTRTFSFIGNHIER